MWRFWNLGQGAWPMQAYQTSYGRGVAGVIECTFQAVIDWCQMSSCCAARCSSRPSSACVIDNSCTVRIPFDDSYLGMSLFTTRSKVIECAFLKYESSNRPLINARCRVAAQLAAAAACQVPTWLVTGTHSIRWLRLSNFFVQNKYRAC